MAGIGAHIFCGWNTADAVLRGLHLLLREEQPELEDHQPPHLIYIYSQTISQHQEQKRLGVGVGVGDWGWHFGVGVVHIERVKPWVILLYNLPKMRE